MRTSTVLLLLLLLSAGCNRAEQARRKAAADSLKQLKLALEAYHADAVQRQEGTHVDVSRIVDAGNQFALDLYQQLRGAEGNLFFSPSSITVALAMTYAGAAGETEAEMAETLRFDLPKDQVHAQMQVLQSLWRTPAAGAGIRLKLANRLWGQEGYEFLPAFLQVTRDKYDAELARLDFAQANQASQEINQWVEAQTEGKITNLISPAALSSVTRLVLTNAVYFHGTWTSPFDKSDTSEAAFHLTAKDKINVPLMYQSGEFRYSTRDGLQILELPYGDGSLSMTILLPKEIEGLQELETKLTLRNLQQWLASVEPIDTVQVFLPKFRTSSQFSLDETLQQMGMRSAFDVVDADFSGMTRARELYISAAIHKAFFDVNEEGTEAAAATGVVMGLRGAPVKPPVLRADHPFVFLIRDNRNGAILFLGRLMNPLK